MSLAGREVGHTFAAPGVGVVGRSFKYHRPRGVFLQLADFGAQFIEFGLTRHVVEATAELIRHRARASRPLAGSAHQTRQILRSHHDERDENDDQNLAPGDIEHSRSSLPRPWPRSRAHGPPEVRRDNELGCDQPCLTSSAFFASTVSLDSIAR